VAALDFFARFGVLFPPNRVPFDVHAAAAAIRRFPGKSIDAFFCLLGRFVERLVRNAVVFVPFSPAGVALATRESGSASKADRAPRALKKRAAALLFNVMVLGCRLLLIWMVLPAESATKPKCSVGPRRRTLKATSTAQPLRIESLPRRERSLLLLGWVCARAFLLVAAVFFFFFFFFDALEPVASFAFPPPDLRGLLRTTRSFFAPRETRPMGNGCLCGPLLFCGDNRKQDLVTEDKRVRVPFRLDRGFFVATVSGIATS
jgi:hypothetical protein